MQVVEKQKARIENWMRVGQVLVGEVYGHPKFNDGEEVVTSTIVSHQDNVVVTQNTIYELGKPYANG